MQSGSDTCLGFRTDRCSGGFVGLGGDGSAIAGTFIVPLDGGFLYVAVNPFTLLSCNPFLISGLAEYVGRTYVGIDSSDTEYNAIFPCLSPCIDRSYIDSLGWQCVTGTVTITEA